jgi:hypothetical protein
MHWRDELDSVLPPTRDDEPQDLRRDIIDELSDHLECAMQRELRTTDDTQSAQRNVLKRFGNPHRIARQLWLEHMKGKLMTQRILIASNVILAVATITIAVFALSALRETREFQTGLVAEMRSSMSEMLDERSIVLTSNNQASNEPPAIAANTTDDDLHEQWAERLAGLTDNWRTAFATGNALLELPPQQGFGILRDNWQHIEHVSSRQQIIKAFAFSVMQDLHPHTMDVMHLGMMDESPDVQSWAMGYLKWIAFEDFSTDFAAYERWHSRHAGTSQRDVMITSFNDWVQQLTAGNPSAYSVLSETSLLSLRDQAFMREAARDSDVQEILETIVQAGVARNANPQQRTRAEHALQRIGEIKPDEHYMRRVVLPIVEMQPASPLTSAALFSLEGERHAWAGSFIMEKLQQVVLDSERDATGNVFTMARVLSSYRDPAVIPELIALIAADNSYTTVYGIGWFGLNPLTGVAYDEAHEGEWWKQWWENNRQRYPEHVRSMDIPELTNRRTAAD